MNKLFFKVQVFAITLVILTIIGCATTKTQSNSMLLDGLWFYYDSEKDYGYRAVFAKTESGDWAGKFQLFIFSTGEIKKEDYAFAYKNGNFALGDINLKYRTVELILGGKYYGDMLEISGPGFAPIQVIKEKPSKSINMANTTYLFRDGDELAVVYHFNDDNTFNIYLVPDAYKKLNSTVWNADLNGTYTINGIEVTLFLPNKRALLVTGASSLMGVARDESKFHVFGNHAYINGTRFQMVEGFTPPKVSE